MELAFLTFMSSSQIVFVVNIGSVHTTQEKFEIAALTLRLGLPSTLIRHENGALLKRFSNWTNFEDGGYIPWEVLSHFFSQGKFP